MSHLNKRNNRRKTNNYAKNNGIDQMHAKQFGKCHYCDEYGHFEDTCPLVEKAAQEQNCKKNVSKEPLRNQLTNTKQTNKGSKSKTCTVCDSPHHTTYEHRRMKSLEDNYSILVNLNDYCGICEEHGHEMFDCKKFNEAKSKDTQSMMTPIIKEDNKSDQEQQKQEYKNDPENSKENPFVEGMCFICKKDGHNTNDCPVFINLGPEQHEYDKQWYTRQHNKEQKVNNFKNSNDGDLEDKKCKKCNKNEHPTSSCDFEKKHSQQQEHEKELDDTLRAYYTSLMQYCPICEERGHDMYDCESFIKAEKEQKDGKQRRKENSKKKPKENNLKNQHNAKNDVKCSKCNKNGHAEDSCYPGEKPGKKQEKCSPKKNSDKRSEEQSNTSKKSHPEFKKIFFPMNQKSIYLSENGKFLKICTVHCICEMCHTKYSSRLNKKATEDHSTDKGPDDDAIRCCFMCGANGLMDSCFWKKPCNT